jgi:hypothetical protein
LDIFDEAHATVAWDALLLAEVAASLNSLTLPG